MAFIADVVFDSGLSVLDTNGTRLDITTTEATSYALATTAGNLSLGSATVAIPAPENGAVDGRRVVIPAITNGSVSTNGTAGFWALTNGSNTLYATGPLTASQVVTSGNTFTLDAISITLRDATAV